MVGCWGGWVGRMRWDVVGWGVAGCAKMVGSRREKEKDW